MNTLTRQSTLTSREKCYACGKAFRGPNEPTGVFLIDDDHHTVLVGPDCAKHVENAHGEGYPPPRGGPRLFWTKTLARAYVETHP